MFALYFYVPYFTGILSPLKGRLTVSTRLQKIKHPSVLLEHLRTLAPTSEKPRQLQRGCRARAAPGHDDEGRILQKVFTVQTFPNLGLRSGSTTRVPSTAVGFQNNRRVRTPAIRGGVLGGALGATPRPTRNTATNASQEFGLKVTLFISFRSMEVRQWRSVGFVGRIWHCWFHVPVFLLPFGVLLVSASRTSYSSLFPGKVSWEKGLPHFSRAPAFKRSQSS